MKLPLLINYISRACTHSQYLIYPFIVFCELQINDTQSALMLNMVFIVSCLQPFLPLCKAV